jgi:nucleotide-binding universal stress UspA family protein
MNNILIPTDFSEGAFNALIHGLHIAKEFDGSVQIIHAYSMPPTGSNVMVDITDILKKNAEEELALLKKRVEGLELAKGIPITYKASYGSVVDVINRLSREQEVSLVVMGTQGASGITEKWLGSNTAAAARNVECPLLAIPAELPYKGISSILFSTDMKVMKNDEPLRFVSDLSKQTGATIKFLHIRDEEEDLEENEEAYRQQVQSIFGEVTPVFTFMYNDEVEEGIEEAIEREDPSLLVVVRHDYGFFKSLWHSSVSRHVINNASLAILVLNG